MNAIDAPVQTEGGPDWGVFRCAMCGADFLVVAPWTASCPACGSQLINEQWTGALEGPSPQQEVE